MKPRTKIQKEVAGLFPKLPHVTDHAWEWLTKECHEKVGFHSCGQTWCANCGHISGEATVFEKGQDELEGYICPHCGAKLRVKKSTKRKYEFKSYATIITTFSGWQVLRHFLLKYECRKKEEPKVEISEVVQEWMNAEGKMVYVALPLAGLSCGSDQWNFNAKLEIRSDRHNYYQYYGSKYEIWAKYIYSQVRVLPILRRNGFTLEACDKAMPPSYLAKKLLYDNECEMLIKTKQFSIANILKYKKDDTIAHYNHAIRIANRNGYKVTDASLWIDYLDLLEYFNLDTHNAHYVCPKDLQKEHDVLLRRKERVMAQKKAEEDRKAAAKWEADYAKMKGAYFGICFGNEHIQISVIKSVAEMAEEGAHMHHCVFSMKYFKKKDSLILSARDSEGNRLETIEVDLRTFKVVQSRGLQNTSSPYHDEIVELVSNNIDKIRKVA